MELKWFDEISGIVVSWGHRYLVEAVATLGFILVLHFFAFPLMVKRAEVLKAASQPRPPSGPTILLLGQSQLQVPTARSRYQFRRNLRKT